MPARATLTLAADGPGGWFGGCGLTASGAAESADGLSLAEAGAVLDEVFSGSRPGLAAALLRYEGPCAVALFAEAGSAPAGPAARVAPSETLLLHARADMDERAYTAAHEHVRDRIAAGDVYVLNLTMRLRGRLALSPSAVFEELRARARASMAAYLELPGGEVVASVSPERFVSVRTLPGGTREAAIEPIKGTRPRGATPAEDDALAAGLASDAKERAEHVMVVDLERNDLGRVCVPGSVRVDPLYEVVRTPYCHQPVSRVVGELRAESGIAGLLAATFPCGSVTGAPKLAAIRIAREVESSPRGAYCGALAVARRSEMDSSVLIRTLECEPDGSAAWGMGGGITIDSVPGREWAEAWLKASPVLGAGAAAAARR